MNTPDRHRPSRSSLERTGQLKIDELAHLSGTSVDTIRFYQREGLLPPTRREGRSTLYGPDHLRQLERIKDLQARHFSLRAIKSLAQEGRLSIVEALFATSGEITPTAGAATGSPNPQLVEELTATGLIVPEDTVVGQGSGVGSGQGFDGAQIAYSPGATAAIRAVEELLAIGMPKSLLFLVVSSYAQHFKELEFDILASVSGETAAVSRDELEAFAEPAELEKLGQAVPLVEAILQHLHHRSLQRIVQGAIEALAEDEPPEIDPSGPDEGD